MVAGARAVLSWHSARGAATEVPASTFYPDIPHSLYEERTLTLEGNSVQPLLTNTGKLQKRHSR